MKREITNFVMHVASLYCVRTREKRGLLAPGLFVLLLGSLSLSACLPREVTPNQNNVILITLDGVRWQEVFRGTDPSLTRGAPSQPLFQNLYRITEGGLRVGNRDEGHDVQVSNPDLISLPAYQSIMTGYTMNCHSNACPRVALNTLGDTLIEELGLKKEQVATFASWSKIALAVEHHPGATYVNAGPHSDAERSNPWNDGEVRLDRHTVASAASYLREVRPRFLYISLNDSDEWSHADDYEGYIATLNQYDAWIAQIDSIVKENPVYAANTTIIVTTDHGRGSGGSWVGHGKQVPDSRYIWLFAINPAARGQGVGASRYSHNNIRPTVEALLGIGPNPSGPSLAAPIRELLPSGS